MKWTGNRRTRRIATLALVLMVAFAALTTRLFILPDLNKPVHSDAAFRVRS
jgi:hypothetical protein